MDDWEPVPSLDLKQWPASDYGELFANRGIAEPGRVWHGIELKDLDKLIGDILSMTEQLSVKVILEFHSNGKNISARLETLAFDNEVIPIEARHASLFQHWLNQTKLKMPLSSTGSDAMIISCHKAAFFWIHST